MPLNMTYAGTQHIRSLADAALQKPDGITVRFKTKGEAIRLRQQFNNVRLSDRRQSQNMYKPGDMQYGTSPYDCLHTVVREHGTDWEVVFNTPKGTLEALEIVDNATGEIIDVEDL